MVRCTWDRVTRQAAEQTAPSGPRRRPGTTSDRCTQIDQEPENQLAKILHACGDKLFLNTQKSGSEIFVPLPKVAVEALKKIENGNAYFFCSGKGLRKSAVADWQRALR